jgi:hypothetical protein
VSRETHHRAYPSLKEWTWRVGTLWSHTVPGKFHFSASFFSHFGFVLFLRHGLHVFPGWPGTYLPGTHSASQVLGLQMGATMSSSASEASTYCGSISLSVFQGLSSTVPFTNCCPPAWLRSIICVGVGVPEFFLPLALGP